MNHLSIYRDPVVSGVHLGAEQPNRLAIDGHPPINNELLAGPAGSHTGVGEKFLKANHEIYDL